MRYASEIKENKGESEPKKHLYLMVWEEMETSAKKFTFMMLHASDFSSYPLGYHFFSNEEEIT
jgi:hypothetical protein